MEAKATGEPQTLAVEDPPAESNEEEINSSVPSPMTVDESTSMEEPPAETISELVVEVWGKSVKVNLSVTKFRYKLWKLLHNYYGGYLHPLPTERDEEALRELVMKMLTSQPEARVPPSFNRNEGSSSSSLVELKDEKLVIVRVKSPTSNNVDGPGVKDEKIPKEEAVCRFCFHKFEDDNVLKTKCRCKFTLIHEHCAIEWSREKGNNIIKCEVCDQDIQNIPVTLLLSDQDNLQKPTRSRNWMGRFMGRA